MEAPISPNSNKTIPIVFNFCDLKLTPYKAKEGISPSKLLKEIFNGLIEDMINNKAHFIERNRGESLDDKRSLLMYGATYTRRGERVRGKIALLRNKAPILMSKKSFTETEIDNDSDKNVAELTHFLIDFSSDIPLVMIEFNDNGPRISDFEYYVRHLGKEFNIAKFCQPTVRIKGDLDDILKNLQNVFSVDLKVRLYKGKFLAKFSDKLYSGIEALNSSYPYQDIRIVANFGHQNTTEGQKKKNTGGLDWARNLLGFLKENPNNAELMEDLKMDIDRGKGLEVIDILSEKESITINVDLLKPGRPLASDLFGKAHVELTNFLKEV